MSHLTNPMTDQIALAFGLDAGMEPGRQFEI